MRQIGKIWPDAISEFRSSFSEKGPIPFLDGLRGLGSLAIIVAHCLPLKEFSTPELSETVHRFGIGAISCFFILSAFLISSYFWELRLKGATDYRMGDYFRRRALRVLPLFYISSAVFFLLYPLLEGNWSVFGIAPYYGLTLHNFTAAHNLVNPPSWSVGVEVHFYIVVALLFWLLRKAPARHIILALAALVLVVAAYKAWAVDYAYTAWAERQGQKLWAAGHIYRSPGEIRDLIFANSLGWLDTFVIGIVIAGIYAYSKAGLVGRIRKHSAFLAGVSAVVVFGVALCAWQGMQNFNLPFMEQVWLDGWRWLGVAVLLGAMFITGLWKWAGIHRLFDLALLRFMGKISFSLYLLHMPLYTWFYYPLMTKLGINPWVSFFSFLLVILPVSFLSYYFLEKPFLKLKKRFRTQPVSPPVAEPQRLTGQVLG